MRDKSASAERRDIHPAFIEQGTGQSDEVQDWFTSSSEVKLNYTDATVYLPILSDVN